MLKRWQVKLLVIITLEASIAAVTSMLIWNPIGLSVIGVVTGVLIALFPSIPWFLPPIVIWLLLFMGLSSAMITMIIAFKRSRAR